MYSLKSHDLPLIYVSIYLCTCVFMYICICVSMYRCIYVLCIYVLCIYVSVYLSVYLVMQAAVRPDPLALKWTGHEELRSVASEDFAADSDSSLDAAATESEEATEIEVLSPRSRGLYEVFKGLAGGRELLTQEGLCKWGYVSRAVQRGLVSQYQVWDTGSAYLREELDLTSPAVNPRRLCISLTVGVCSRDTLVRIGVFSVRTDYINSSLRPIDQ